MRDGFHHGDWRHRIGLPILFSLVVFLILVVTAMIMGFLAFVAYRVGLFDRMDLQQGPHWYVPVFFLIVISVVVGTMVSFIGSRFPLRPLRRVINAINLLAKGDFSVRLSLRGPAEFQELEKSFNSMAEELGGIEILRSDFVNNFSHEFKTPIVSIKGFAEMLKYDDLSSGQREEYLDIIISESKRLTSLATNVLDLSKLENQTILTDVEHFDLAEQLRRCILVLENQWAQKDITLSLNIEDVTCEGNEEMLNQVWINLISNAIKFTPPQGNIEINLRRLGERIAFSIIDSGEGISEEATKHIFEKFYQADTSHTSEGYGLGLTVAQRIVQMHNGSIACRNTQSRGTEFSVELPARQ